MLHILAFYSCTYLLLVVTFYRQRQAWAWGLSPRKTSLVPTTKQNCAKNQGPQFLTMIANVCGTSAYRFLQELLMYAIFLFDVYLLYTLVQCFFRVCPCSALQLFSSTKLLPDFYWLVDWLLLTGVADADAVLPWQPDLSDDGDQLWEVQETAAGLGTDRSV